jgi:hypothetical protein
MTDTLLSSIHAYAAGFLYDSEVAAWLPVRGFIYSSYPYTACLRRLRYRVFALSYVYVQQTKSQIQTRRQ